MQLDQEELRVIIKEEIDSITETQVIQEDTGEVLKKVGVAAGTALMTAMMSTSSGRNTLANILTALPDFVIDTLCAKPDLLAKGVDSRLVQIAGTAVTMACKASGTLVFSPLLAVAWLLRSIDDETAKAVVDGAKKAGTGSEPSTDVQDADSDGIPDAVDLDVPDDISDIDDVRMVAEILRRMDDVLE